MMRATTGYYEIGALFSRSSLHRALLLAVFLGTGSACAAQWTKQDRDVVMGNCLVGKVLDRDAPDAEKQQAIMQCACSTEKMEAQLSKSDMAHIETLSQAEFDSDAAGKKFIAIMDSCSK